MLKIAFRQLEPLKQEEVFRRNFVRQTALVFSIVLIIGYFARISITGPGDIVQTTLLLMILSVSIGVRMFLSRGGSLRVGSNILLLGVLGPMSLIIFLGGGILVPLSSLLPLFAVFAGIALGRRGALAYTILILLILCVIYLNTPNDGRLTHNFHSFDLFQKAKLVVLSAVCLLGLSVGIVIGATHRFATRMAEEKSLQESVIRLSGDLAHQINSPLSSILLRAESINRRVQKADLAKDQIKEAIDAIIYSAKKIDRLTKIMSAYSGMESLNSSQSDSSIESVLMDALELFRLRHVESEYVFLMDPIEGDLRMNLYANRLSFAFLGLLEDCFQKLIEGKSCRIRITIQDRQVIINMESVELQADSLSYGMSLMKLFCRESKWDLRTEQLPGSLVILMTPPPE